MKRIDLAKAVATIAKDAGAAILDIYHNAENYEVEQKSDDSPLTVADRTANTIICDGLEKLEVQYPIISEENKSIPYEERKDYASAWLVDPLDGTKEFIKRNGEFTVNIALIEKGKSTLGVVYAPVLDELYWAVEGEGAYLEKNGQTTQLHAKSFEMANKNLGVVCSRSHLNDATKEFVEKLNEPELVSKGSSLKFLLIAKGEAHVYPRLAPTMEWDTAAAHVVVTEAGGQVIAQDTMLPLMYNKENLLNPHFVAYGQKEG